MKKIISYCCVVLICCCGCVNKNAHIEKANKNKELALLFLSLDFLGEAITLLEVDTVDSATKMNTLVEQYEKIAEEQSLLCNDYYMQMNNILITLTLISGNDCRSDFISSKNDFRNIYTFDEMFEYVINLNPSQRTKITDESFINFNTFYVDSLKQVVSRLVMYKDGLFPELGIRMSEEQCILIQNRFNRVYEEIDEDERDTFLLFSIMFSLMAQRSIDDLSYKNEFDFIEESAFTKIIERRSKLSDNGLLFLKKYYYNDAGSSLYINRIISLKIEKGNADKETFKEVDIRY